MTALFDERRPELEGISEFYNRELRPQLEQLEAERVKEVATLKALSVFTLCLGFVVSIIFGLAQNDWEIFAWGFWITCLIALGVRFAYSGKPHMQSAVFLSERLCRFVGWDYFPGIQSFREFDVFTGLGIIPSGSDRISFEDGVAGRANGYDFNYVECHLETRHEREDDDGNVEVYWTTDFRGALMTTGFPREFLGQMVILSDSGWFNSKNWGDLDRVGLADPHFEDVFEVYGSDQVEARYILTPTFMERLLILKAALKWEIIQLGFYQNTVLISVGSTDKFEGRSDIPAITAKEQPQSILNDIEDIFMIMETVINPKKVR